MTVFISQGWLYGAGSLTALDTMQPTGYCVQNLHFFAILTHLSLHKWIVENEKFCMLIKMSLNLVPKGPIDNNSALI